MINLSELEKFWNDEQTFSISYTPKINYYVWHFINKKKEIENEKTNENKKMKTKALLDMIENVQNAVQYIHLLHLNVGDVIKIKNTF